MSSNDLSPSSQAPVVRVSKRRTHQVTTAMAAFVLAGFAAPSAFADGGAGGGGATGGADTSGNFGTGGGNGSGASQGGGGGGAAGLEGGQGGNATNSAGSTIFGTGGIPGGGPGSNGGSGLAGIASGFGGGGGAGAAHAFVGAAFPGAPAVGGNGGAGGGGLDAGGGGGGAGGYGLIITGSGDLGALIDPATGGSGGAGGDGTFGGAGGSGGVGLSFTGASAFTATINGNVTGGAGGFGGSGDVGGADGANGAGGVGIIAASNATLTLGATVSGGLSGSQRANAIQFLGATNQLSLNVGGALVGGVSTAGDLTLLQFTDTTFANDFSGTGRLIIDGGAVVTLSGNNTQAGGTVVNTGVLQITSASALSPSFLGTAVSSGATLRFTNSAPAVIGGGVNGAGLVELRGSAPVTLGPVNLTGTLNIGAGAALVLQPSFFGANSLGTVVNNGAMTIDSGAQFTTGSSGTGTLTLTGGTLFSPSLITGVHTHTGGTTIASGAIVRIGAAGGVADTIGGVITNNGSLTYAFDATAANSTITSSGQLVFNGSATAGNANITLLSGSGSIGGNADGATSAWTLQGSSSLSILDSTRATASGLRGVTIGSLASSSATSTVSIGGYPEILGGPGRELTVGANNQSTTFAGIIQNGGDANSGPGSLVKAGTGTLTLTGANTFNGGTSINGGVLNVSSDANLGGASGGLSFGGGTLQLGGSFNIGAPRAMTLNAGGGTIDTNSFNTTIGQAVSGAGALTKIGAGTLTLGGTNTYAGGTAINGGVVNASSDANLGTASGGLSFAGGTLQLGAAFNVGAPRTVTLNAGGGTIDTNGFNTTIGQAITGAGSLTKTGAGTLTLGGTNTYAGGTAINGGVVIASSDGNFGAASGGLSFAGGTLQLGGSFNVATTRGVTLNAGGGTVDTNGFNTTIGQTITGAGSLTKIGAGTLTLGGASTYTGGTAINGGVVNASSDANFGGASGGLSFAGGTLRLGNAFNVGSGRAIAFNAGGATLDTNGFNSSISQAITGAGGLRKEGLGTLTLSGASTFGGATTVGAGTLLVNGSLTSPVTVATGATLGGSGAVGALTVNGTLSPGNSPGVLTVNGNLNLASSSVYLVEVLQATADRTNVTGTASLNGTLRLVALGAPYTFGTPYVLISAAGGLGGTTFTTLDSAANAFGAGVRPLVTYTANEVRLTLSAAELPTTGLTNARNAAGGINTAVAAGANPDAFFPLFNLAAPAMPAALNTVSGEVHAAANAMGFQANDQFLRVMLDPFAATARTENASGLIAWVAPFGVERTVEGDGSVIGSAEQTVTTSNIAFGLDAAVASNLRVGASVSTGSAQTKLAQQRGKADADVTQFGAYANANVGPVKLGAALSYSDYEIGTTRVVPVFANAVLRGEYGAEAWGVRVEGEMPIASFAGATLSALGAYRSISLDTPAFAENAAAGGAFAGANVATKDATSSRTELGLKLESDAMFGRDSWRGYAQASWAHALEGDYDATLSLAGLAGSRFTVFAAEPTEDTLLLRAGLSGALNERVTLSGRLEGETGNGVSEFGAILQARIGF